MIEFPLTAKGVRFEAHAQSTMYDGRAETTYAATHKGRTFDVSVEEWPSGWRITVGNDEYVMLYGYANAGGPRDERDALRMAAPHVIALAHDAARRRVAQERRREYDRGA